MEMSHDLLIDRSVLYLLIYLFISLLTKRSTLLAVRKLLFQGCKGPEALAVPFSLR